jgi:hypothetical protein
MSKKKFELNEEEAYQQSMEDFYGKQTLRILLMFLVIIPIFFYFLITTTFKRLIGDGERRK